MADEQTPPPADTSSKSRPSNASLSPASSNENAIRSATISPVTSPHRMSFTQSLRSPRHTRQPSIGFQGLQDLLHNPPFPNKTPNPYQGKDWKEIKVGELTDPNEVHWVEFESTVEEATNVLVASGPPNVVLLRKDKNTRLYEGSFDYSTLNGYTLLILGMIQLDPDEQNLYRNVIRRARNGEPVLLSEIQETGMTERSFQMQQSNTLASAIAVFASGIHRIVVLKDGTNEVHGVLSQLRTVRFFWDYGRGFSDIVPLFGKSLVEHGILPKPVKSINGDRPLAEALKMIHDANISSLPVLDSSANVIGNISQVDVKLLTRSSALPLLGESCTHFISVILSERGLEAGIDSVPVFYVYQHSTLTHTVAKLVATRSHRMWIVEGPSPVSSTPQTPISTVAPPPSPMSHSYGPPYTTMHGSSISAASLPGQHMSGRLTGMVSLTDVIMIIGLNSGLVQEDPKVARQRRRRQGSSPNASR